MKNKIFKTTFLAFLILWLGALHADVVDDQRAIDFKKWDANQNKLPDSKRYKLGGFEEDLLIEKNTGLTIGTHKTIINGKNRIELKILTKKSSQSFIIGGMDTCPESTFRVLSNQPNFLYMVNSCFYTNKNKEQENSYTYLLFDKHKNTVIDIETTSSFRKEKPTITYANGLYKYRWSGLRSDGNKIDVGFDFKIQSSTNVICLKSWNDECPSPVGKKNP